jgi:hypothetical protein
VLPTEMTEFNCWSIAVGTREYYSNVGCFDWLAGVMGSVGDL